MHATEEPATSNDNSCSIDSTDCALRLRERRRHCKRQLGTSADAGRVTDTTDLQPRAPPRTEATDTGGSEPATGDEGIARAALLQPDDIGDDWQDYGPDSAFPMTAELAAAVPSCAPFVDVVFDGNTGVWASTGLGRDMDIAFTSVTVFPTEAEAAAMVAATATPEFDQCWADFNEVAVVELPFGIESASYESVEPPDVALGGDSSSLHALDGTITLGSSEVPDSCVCAFVQQGSDRRRLSLRGARLQRSGTRRCDRHRCGPSRRDGRVAHVDAEDGLLSVADPSASHERSHEHRREP